MVFNAKELSLYKMVTSLNERSCPRQIDIYLNQYLNLKA